MTIVEYDACSALERDRVARDVLSPRMRVVSAECNVHSRSRRSVPPGGSHVRWLVQLLWEETALGRGSALPETQGE